VLLGSAISGSNWSSYDAAETPATAVQRAIAHWGSPTVSAETRAVLENFASRHNTTAEQKAQRQNVLRQMLACTPDYLTS
jgi:hypothetical protein